MDVAFEMTSEFWKALFQDPNSMFHANQTTSDISAAEDNLHHHMCWEVETQDLLVVPSLSFSQVELSPITGVLLTTSAFNMSLWQRI
jgi:hypothetical protein